MSTTPVHDHNLGSDDTSSTDGENLLFWLGGVMLVMTLLIIFAITQLSTGAGLAVAFGSLLVAMGIVFAYIWRFIGPDENH
jgi:hypothetical protein